MWNAISLVQDLNYNNNKTNRINLYWKKQIHKNYKLDQQVRTHNLLRHIQPTKSQKQINFTIYNTKVKTSNLIVKNNTNTTKLP